MKLFSKVEEIFTIPTRGCVIVPATPSDPDFRPHKRDSIQLRSPGGEAIDTHIVSIELLKPLAGPCRMAFLLPNEIAKSDIPRDAEIWIESSK
jgi:hypothetical protein